VIEKAKFGRIFGEGELAGKVFTEFDVMYDSEVKEIIVSIPIEALSFEAEGDKLRAEFSFEFYIYSKKSPKKEQLIRQKIFETTEEEALEMQRVVLAFPYDLKPGEYYFDVVVVIDTKIGKVRKIFKIRI
jgi:hypothetical protein